MCSTLETVRSTSIKGEFNGPLDLPPGIVSDAIINRFIGIKKRQRRQLVIDFGCVREGSNIVPDLIDLEVAHWLKLQLMAEGLPGNNQNPNDPPPMGLVREGELDKDGTKSKIVRALADAALGDLLGEEGYALTPYGQLWYSLWSCLPVEYTAGNRYAGCRGMLPIASKKLGWF